MQYLIALLVLNCISFAMHKKLKLNPTTSFLVTIFTGVALAFVGGVFNFLFLGTAAFYTVGLLCFFAVLFIDRKCLSLSYLKTYFTLPNVLSISAMLMFFVIYVIQNPLFSYWDEYSFWGTAAKIAIETDNFAPIYKFNFLWNEYVIAGSTALVYLLHFFGNTFNDYGHYFAYTVMTISSFATVAEYIQDKTKVKFITPLTFLLLFLLPFLQNNHSIDADYYSISYAYGTSMVDFLLVTYMVSAVVTYLSSPKIPYFIMPLFVLAASKDVGIFFALLSICVIACFAIFIKHNNKKMYVIKVVILIIAAVTAYSTNILWVHHLHINDNDASQETPYFSPWHLEYQREVSVAQNSTIEIIPAEKDGNLLLQIVSPEYRTSAQNAVLNDIWAQFNNSSTAVQIPDKYLVIILIVVGLICSFIIDKKYRLALILANLGLPIGYFLYCSAISLFIANFNDGMVEYPRYSLTYYWFWIYFVCSLLIIACVTIKKYLPIYLLLLIVVSAVYVRGVDYTVVSAPDNPHNIATEYKLELEKYQEIFNTAEHIFMVAPRFDDYKYMLGLHNAIPAPVNADINRVTFDFSMNFSNKEFLTDETLKYFIVANDEEFLQIIFETFDYILILHPQEEFVNSYGEFFDKEPTEFALYKINQSSTVPFESVMP